MLRWRLWPGIPSSLWFAFSCESARTWTCLHVHPAPSTWRRWPIPWALLSFLLLLALLGGISAASESFWSSPLPMISSHFLSFAFLSRIFVEKTTVGTSAAATAPCKVLALKMGERNQNLSVKKRKVFTGIFAQGFLFLFPNILSTWKISRLRSTYFCCTRAKKLIVFCYVEIKFW